MVRLGRPFPDREERIKSAVFNSLSDSPGRTLDEMAANVKMATGADRTTVWRHLKHFVKIGLAVKDGPLYRWNPIYGIKVPGFSLDMKAATIMFDGRETDIIAALRKVMQISRASEPEVPAHMAADSMRQAVQIDYWDPKRTIGIVNGPKSLMDFNNPVRFEIVLKVMMWVSLLTYMSLLETLSHAPTGLRLEKSPTLNCDL